MTDPDDASPQDLALDWVVNWAMTQDSQARDHYFHICDQVAAECGCKYEGEGVSE